MLRRLCAVGFNKFHMQRSCGVIEDLVHLLARKARPPRRKLPAPVCPPARPPAGPALPSIGLYLSHLSCVSLSISLCLPIVPFIA